MQRRQAYCPTLIRSDIVLVALGILAAAGAGRAGENPHGRELPDAPLPARIDFNRDIRPFLSAKCWHCHGPDEKSREADLRLDLRNEAVRDLGGYRAVQPGNPGDSEVVKRIISTDRDEVMPPPKEGHPLTSREIELIRKWIAQGATYAQHWAFVPPTRPNPPPVAKLRSPVANPIDAFVAARLAEHGLSMSPRADRHTLIRRLSLDLTGLPPTPQQTAEFVNDSGPDAYGRLVDRLLAATSFGERWARVWLDIARYADSAGYGSDPLRLNIWPYRDWVIRAFNRNLPYDQFTVEQLAGDLLPGAADDQILATAFHRNTMTNTEGGTDDEEFRIAAVKDRVAVTVQTWMGLTMGCAQCHSHKFDPVSQREYYQFFAVFNQTEDSDKADESPTMPLPTPEQRKKMGAIKAEIATLEKQLAVPSSGEFLRELADWERRVARPVSWTVLKPLSAFAKSGGRVDLGTDGGVFPVGDNPSAESLTIKVRTSLKGITAFRLEALPDERLPKGGPGRVDHGRMVLKEFRVSAGSSVESPMPARYVRVDLPGTKKMLSLAEVEVFSSGRNVAPRGRAAQSSTYGEAAAARAIDGNTDGEYRRSSSVTHTENTDNPWWELDLGRVHRIEQVVLWNRTDGATGSRLNGARLSVLDENRRPVLQQVMARAPETRATFAVSGANPIALQHAAADVAQAGFEAAKAIDGVAETGWSFDDATGSAHAITFETTQPVGDGRELELSFVVDTGGMERNSLGRVRLLATTQAPPVQELPAEIRGILARPHGQRSEAQRQTLAGHFQPRSRSLAAVQAQLNGKRAELATTKPVGVPVLRELPGDKQRITRVLNKGNFLDPGEVVKPAMLRSFHAQPGGAAMNRLSMARWLMSDGNPLTARVAVNRFWAQLFGLGLVETEEDFGTQGTLPSHPELLDWLAVHFRDDLQWDVKGLIRTIVSSATYQQVSKVDPARLQKDPRCQWLSRYPRRRLDAEQVRDQALALSGLLSGKIGGPSVFPPQPEGLWRAAFNGQRNWDTSKGEDRYRRGLYTFWRRTVPYPSMATFDAPSRENCTLRRSPTNTPLHAFVTLNDPAFFEMAQALGRRIIREGGASPESRARFGLELVLCRPASAEQIAALVGLYRNEFAGYRARPQDAERISAAPAAPSVSGSDASEAAAWTMVANVLLNLDGVLMKG